MIRAALESHIIDLTRADLKAQLEDIDLANQMRDAVIPSEKWVSPQSFNALQPF